MAILPLAPSMAPLTETDEHGRTTLMRAIISNDKDSMLSHAPFEWGWADVDGYTALMHAVQLDNIEAVKLLIDFEYPFTLPDTRTALMLAIKHRRYRLVPLMTERLSRLTNKHGYNALMYAVTLGDLEMVRILIDSWPNSCREDLLAANDVVDLGPVDARDAIFELLRISLARLPDVAQFNRRILCMGVIPKKAIPNHANGIYPIDVHFHEENVSWRETEAQLCETIKLLHTKIEALESSQLKRVSRCVSRHVSAAQEHKSICLQTPFDWGNQSWTLAKLLSKLDSKQRRIAILEEELLILQGKDTVDKTDRSFFKEASDLRIKERTLKERITILERAMDEHIGIINSILNTSCQSLMEVESTIKSVAHTEVQLQNTSVPMHPSLDDVNTRICSPMTVIQEVSIVATGCDKGTNPEINTADAYAQAITDENSVSEITSFRQRLNEKEALLDKICSVIKVKEEDHADGQVIVSAIDGILRQNASLQSELKSASEKLLEHCTKSALLHNLLTNTGVDSIEALAAHIFTTQQELAQYKSRAGNVTSSDPMPTAKNTDHNIYNNGKSSANQVSCQYSGNADPAQVSALLRQLSSYTQRPCTTITDAMHLIHEYCVRAASERIALQKTRDDVEREHSIARGARAALADQEAAYNALVNKHTVLLNDAQHLAMKYNDLGRKYNDLYAAHEQLQGVLAVTKQRAIQQQFPKSVRFADTTGPAEKDTEHESNSRFNGDQLQIPINVADAAYAQITYEVSADGAGHMRRSMSVDDAKKLINRQVTKQKTRSQSTVSNSPLYPMWNCCTSTDISKWLRRPLFV
ncbi:Hypothetical protein GLP15_3830 [Giardia lamblia P15]|uniref:Uncharacterized protein n=1 Tax=Giardia intestinalis (strain P15) TaxID=658858 RepID=E1F9E9_GIAIA|nr:Hypothetical protein GLP15_3830 [Giardia lamblia P15]